MAAMAAMASTGTPTVGVVGAGTMGAGIAEAAARAGCPVRLHDPFPEAIARGLERIEKSLRRSAERGSISDDDAKAALARVEAAEKLEALTGCDVVIEAAPEDRAIKEDLFRRLDAACPAPAVLATNTSSLSVTAIGATVADPGRVVGMHFFNPAPVMRLVEVVAGAQSRSEAVQTAEELAQRMGKTPVRASDTPGFIVNRVARPFYGEALRMLGEGIAGVEAIDATMRELGYRMGPFELIDLIGVDVNLAVTRSVWEATFYEPRYRPHSIQARLAEAGMHGRKTGRGFYGYDADGKKLGPSEGVEPVRPPEAAPGIALPGGIEAAATIVAGRLGLPESALDDGRAAIAARMLAMLVNEAVFAVDDGVASPEGVDTALRLGANHPKGPFQWMSELGPGLAFALMDGLWDWYREERYRPAPGLRLRAQKGEPDA
jgi:3-hydroxybutyryl-CoA dehydrogenase